MAALAALAMVGGACGGESEPSTDLEVAGSEFRFSSGTYQVICAIEGHFNGGMEGSLTVVDG